MSDFQCPAGYTCDIDIYPAWHDFALLGLIVFLVLALGFFVWRTAR